MSNIISVHKCSFLVIRKDIVFQVTVIQVTLLIPAPNLGHKEPDCARVPALRGPTPEVSGGLWQQFLNLYLGSAAVVHCGRPAFLNLLAG